MFELRRNSRDLIVNDFLLNNIILMQYYWNNIKWYYLVIL